MHASEGWYRYGDLRKGGWSSLRAPQRDYEPKLSDVAHAESSQPRPEFGFADETNRLLVLSRRIRLAHVDPLVQLFKTNPLLR
jgi:hypothetical protein